MRKGMQSDLSVLRWNTLVGLSAQTLVWQGNCLAVCCSLLMGCDILCNDIFSFPWYAICFEWASGSPVLNYIGWSECTDTGSTGKLPGCSLQFAEWLWLLFAIEWFWFKWNCFKDATREIKSLKKNDTQKFLLCHFNLCTNLKRCLPNIGTVCSMHIVCFDWILPCWQNGLGNCKAQVQGEKRQCQTH